MPPSIWPVTAAVLHPFLLWDGRADSAWLQPLKAIENPKEMDFTRVEVARYASEPGPRTVIPARSLKIAPP